MRAATLGAPARLCDWLSVSQTHPGGGLPRVCSMMVEGTDTDSGELLWRSGRALQHGGSFSTSVRVSCDGERVTLCGNIGRLDRPDNVFGYSLDECKVLASRLVERLGLPPFSGAPRVNRAADRAETAGECPENRGARISRVDIAENFCVGSEKRRGDFLYWLSGQSLTRSKCATHYARETVYSGRRGYVRMKVYDKTTDALRRFSALRRGLRPESPEDGWLAGYLDELGAYLQSEGLVRAEAEFGRKFLHRAGLTHWHDCTDEAITQHWHAYRDKAMNRTVREDGLDELPPSTRGVLALYQAGVNVRGVYRSSAFYKHRARLLEHGIDIAKTLNVRALAIKPRVVEIRPASMPGFYHRPPVAAVQLRAVR